MLSKKDSVEFEENLNYDQFDTPHVYVVTLEQNPTAIKHGLNSTYELQICSISFNLVERIGKKSLFVWPFRYIRRYGRSDEIFQFEAGRRCSTGEGLFSFKCKKGDAEVIFNLVQARFKAIKSRDQEFNAPKTASSASSTSAGVELLKQNLDSKLSLPINKPKVLPKALPPKPSRSDSVGSERANAASVDSNHNIESKVKDKYQNMSISNRSKPPRLQEIIAKHRDTLLKQAEDSTYDTSVKHLENAYDCVEVNKPSSTSSPENPYDVM